MKRTTLSPRDAAWLNATFVRNASRFGGWKMMAEPEPKPDPVIDPKTSPKPDPKPDDEPLGDGGKKALQAERDARKALETEMADLKKSIAEAFGVKPASDKDADVLVAVQESLAEIKRESAVLRLANEHQITDKDDLELLAATHDPDAQGKLAARLAAKKDDGPGTPKPDLSQGPKGDQPKPDSLPGVPRMAAAFDDAMNTN